jgi:hypothetical protein
VYISVMLTPSTLADAALEPSDNFSQLCLQSSHDEGAVQVCIDMFSIECFPM